MLRLLAALLLVPTAAAQGARVEALAGVTTTGAVTGPGPAVGLTVGRPLGAGRLLATARFEVIAVDRAALAEGYRYDPFSATCADRDTGAPADAYLCDPTGSLDDVLGAYGLEAAYAPPLPVGLALGVGLRYGETVDPAEGKGARLGPVGVARLSVPVAGRVGLEALGRIGTDVRAAHVGLSVGL